MAKSRAVKDLLVTAIALASTIDNVELKAGVEALEAVEDANGNTQEYKDLKELVGTLEADAENGAEAVEDANGAKDEPKKLDYAGVRMIGSKWHCAKDNYKKGFDTADECAEHFNG